MDERVIHRAAIHAALGDPNRLAIVDDLRVSDRSPAELARRFGLRSNLVAHHLDVLETVGLIERVASDGDRRRRYVRLVPDRLVETVSLPAPLPSGGAVLFVCTHNSARSQLAAALWADRTGGASDSAGTHPAARVHPGAVVAARRAGLDLAAARPRLLAPDETADLVITVCDRVHEELDPPPSWWHWSIPDPAESASADAFDDVVAELDTRIRALAPA